MKTIDLKISGMRDETCAKKAAQVLQSAPGVLSAKVDLSTGSARVEGQKLDLAQLQVALSHQGFGAERQDSHPDAEERLYVDARDIDLSPNFWCHMGRYLHARAIAASLRAARGHELRILDAASGTGYGSYLLSRAGDTCDGVDIEPQAIAFSRERYGRSNCRFTAGSVLDLPFEEATFDVVVSFETIEHLAREQQTEFVRELRRVVKPGGRAMLSAPVREGGLEAPDYNHHHAYEPDPIELTELARHYFENVAVRGQLLRSIHTAPPTNSPNGNAARARPRAAHKAREVVRNTANTLLKSCYLDRPSTLETVMNTLYTGYLVKPLDLQLQRATFLVLEAQA